MYYDPAAFDFDSLTDIVSFDSEEQAKAKPTKPQATKPIDDASELFNYSGLDNTDDFEDDYEDDPNSNISDILSGTTDSRDAYSVAEALENFDDYQPISFGDFTMTKEELRNFKRDKEMLERDKGYFSENAKAIDNTITAINSRRFMHSTVLENNINVLTKRKQNPNITPEEYHRADMELQSNINSYNQLMNEVNQSLAQVEQDKHRFNADRIRNADYLLTQENPQWMQHKDKIINHLAEMGFTDQMIQTMGDVPLFKLATDSYLLNQNKKRIQDQLKQTTAVNARSTVGAKTSNRANTKEEQAKVKSAISKIGTSRQSNVDAFKYLKD